MWITNGTIAHIAVIWAKTDDGIRGFLVEAGTPGFQATRIQRKFSYRTSPTSLLVFKDCFLPEESLLPEARGLRAVFQCLNNARYGVACGALGSAIACFEAARSYARTRKVFAKPIASYQLVQERLVRMIVEITKAQLITLQLGRLMDRNMGRARPDLTGEVEQCAGGHEYSPDGPGYFGRKGNPGRSSCDPTSMRPGSGQHPGRHGKHAHPDHRPRSYRHLCLFLKNSEGDLRSLCAFHLRPG